jgi:predicted ATPase
MLKRLYVHNYKCLVNFEINFEQDVSLFLGANGSGKSTVFEVLNKLRQVIINEEKIENIFDGSNSPRWLTNDSKDKDIHFEIDIETNNSIYKYTLTIGFESGFGSFFQHRIKSESLYFSNEKFINKKLIESKEKETIFSGENSPIISFDGSRSGIARYCSIIADDFLQSISSIFIARINPYEMISTIDRANANKANVEIKTNFSNFSEWFYFFHKTNRRGITNFEEQIREVFPNYDIFTIQPSGQADLLVFEFKNNINKKDPIKYCFDELSEGQKVLIALYTLIYCTPDNSIICIDEPENFLALPEIQPWFDTLYDQCAERNLQVLLISHHPKIINLLASNSGYWFSRENNLTRIQKITPEDESGLSISELIERGWIYEH